MEAPFPAEEAADGLDALANAAAEGEMADVQSEPKLKVPKPRKTAKDLASSDTEIALLRNEGLTDLGAKKLKSGDTRCRPALHLRKLFRKLLPQFRMKTVVDAAHAEDVVMLWAYPTKEEQELRVNEFRFKPETYEVELMKGIIQVTNDPAEMEKFIKSRYEGSRKIKEDTDNVSPPKRIAGAGNSGKRIRAEFEGESLDVDKSSRLKTCREREPKRSYREYIEMFENSARSKRLGGEPYGGVRPEEEVEIRALHMAAWLGDESAVTEFFLRGNAQTLINKEFGPFKVTALHQAVLGSWENTTPITQEEKKQKKKDTKAPAAGKPRIINSLGTVKLLLARSANLEARDSMGRTPLYLASKRHDLRMMQLLISKGADVNAAAANGSLPLHAAAESGSKSAVELLIKEGAKDSVNGAVALCGSALHWAARNGHRDVVMILVEAGSRVAATDWNGATPLHRAAEAGHRTTTLYLIGNNAPIDATDDDGCSAMHLAATSGQIDCVSMLLGKNAKMNKDKYGWTPLMRAAAGGYEKTVKVLLDAKADVEDTNQRGRTALHLAAVEGWHKVVKVLLETGANIERRDNDGSTPLLLAVRGDQVECARLLLERGADIKSCDNLGSCALAVAALNGHEALLELLLASGADVCCANSEGRMPLHFAAENGDACIVDVLIQKGAKCNVSDKHGQTPLHIAAISGNTRAIKVLLQHGADASLQNLQKATPLDLAMAGHHIGAIEALGGDHTDTDAMARASEQYGSGTIYAKVVDRSNIQAVELLWQERFNMLVDFLKVYNRVPAPGDWHNNYALGTWVELQRKRILWDLMPERQMNALAVHREELKKSWRAAIRWEDWYKVLLDFVAVNSRLPDPWEKWGPLGSEALHGSPRSAEEDEQEQQSVAAASEQYNIGWWCKFQQCMVSHLKESEKACLERVPGWRWEGDFRRKQRFMVRYFLLDSFVKKYNCLPAVDESYAGFPLGKWCAALREVGTMREVSVEIEIAMEKFKDWRWAVSASPSLSSWEEVLANLKKFVQDNGRLPRLYESKGKNSKYLGAWLREQRSRAWKHRLSKERIAALETIPGWREYVHGDQWKPMLRVLTQYVKENRKLPDKDLVVDGLHVGTWFRDQNARWENGTMTLLQANSLAFAADWKILLSQDNADLEWGDASDDLLLKRLVNMQLWTKTGRTEQFHTDPLLQGWVERELVKGNRADVIKEEPKEEEKDLVKRKPAAKKVVKRSKKIEPMEVDEVEGARLEKGGEEKAGMTIVQPAPAAPPAPIAQPAPISQPAALVVHPPAPAPAAAPTIAPDIKREALPKLVASSLGASQPLLGSMPAAPAMPAAPRPGSIPGPVPPTIPPMGPLPMGPMPQMPQMYGFYQQNQMPQMPLNSFQPTLNTSALGFPGYLNQSFPPTNVPRPLPPGATQSAPPAVGSQPPPLSSLPDHLKTLLQSTSPDDPLAMSKALRAVQQAGVGGAAMRWAAAQCVGKKIPGDIVKDMFCSTRDLLLQDNLDEAVEWVEAIKESQ